MKKSIMTMSVALALVIGQVPMAEAGKKEWAAVAGFVGGVLVANAVQGQQTCYQEPVQVYHQPKVVYEQHAPAYHQRPQYQRRGRHHPSPPPQGYYEWRTERVWVPGSWITEELRCGTRRRVWQPGYYQTVRNRVWVQACSW